MAVIEDLAVAERPGRVRSNVPAAIRIDSSRQGWTIKERKKEQTADEYQKIEYFDDSRPAA